MRNAIFALAFLGSLALASGIYFGLKIESIKLLGKIGQNDFQLVEKISLRENSGNNSENKIVKKEKAAEKPAKKSSKKKIEQKIATSATDSNKNSNQVNDYDFGNSQLGLNSNLAGNLFPASIQTATTALVIAVSATTAETAAINNISAEIGLTQISENTSQSNTNSANIVNHVLISEVMAGADGNSAYEFVELYNPTASAIDLTGWTIKKISSTGSESSLLVASRLEGKTIGPGKYFLAVNEGGYNGQVAADVVWATSNTLAYSNNAIILYNAKSEKIEEISWTEIPKNQSYTRQSLENNQFNIQSPTPQNTSY